MVVAFGTLIRHRQKRFPIRIGPIGHVFNAVFFINDTTLLRDFVIAIKTRGEHHLFSGRVIGFFTLLFG